MNWFTRLFSTGVGDVLGELGNIVDTLHTSDAEKEALKIQFKQKMNNFELSMQDKIIDYDKEITKRHETDQKSDSWLSKNVRPLVLIFLTVMTIALAWASIFRLSADEVVLVTPWINLLIILDTTVYAFYFGSRGSEKITNIIVSRNKSKEKHDA